MKYGQTKKIDEKMVCSENNNADENLVKSIPVIQLKKSPALLAEKIIQEKMTDEQRNHEYEVQQKQLAQIFELMQKQSDKFGNISLSEVREQFKLYQ
ncbi:Matrix-remodeling-associated protein 7 like protein [Argiope bruennichi]|uniref:Matrix-remodeling-associated protein 7 like protein n=2 Tax=Argiope bruennichi TaxID=94029 RepID=A0A8T0DZD4_ARGBR|nr:Matrix-remodeling-associated protein 7 like protein [Argiope bruennichi]